MKRLSFANVFSLVALFIVLGGVSYAAIHLPRASVGKKQLKKHAVTASKLANQSVYRRSLSPGLREKLDAEGATASSGVYRIRYQAAASASPSLEVVLDMPGLRMRAQCIQAGTTTSLQFGGVSSEDTLTRQTFIVDFDPDPFAPGNDGEGNVQAQVPAGVEQFSPPLPADDPDVTRIIIAQIANSQSRTITLNLVLIADAQNDRCSMNGTAIPAS